MIKIVSLGGLFGNVGSGILTGIIWFAYLLPVILVVGFIIYKVRVKSIYKHPVRVFKVRENNKVKEMNYRGGYIGRKNSAPFFRIKTGRWWWQQIDMVTTPKVKYMDEEDRVYYLQIDVSTFIQLRREINLKKDQLVKFTPVESDVKYGAILSVQRIKDVLRAEPTWKKVLPYATIIFLGMILLAGYAILLNTKCP